VKQKTVWCPAVRVDGLVEATIGYHIALS